MRNTVGIEVVEMRSSIGGGSKGTQGSKEGRRTDERGPQNVQKEPPEISRESDVQLQPKPPRLSFLGCCIHE